MSPIDIFGHLEISTIRDGPADNIHSKVPLTMHFRRNLNKQVEMQVALRTGNMNKSTRLSKRTICHEGWLVINKTIEVSGYSLVNNVMQPLPLV